MKKKVKIKSTIANKHIIRPSKTEQEIIDQQNRDALQEDAARRHREDVMHVTIADTRTPPCDC
jgi:predicted ThiF/HesA family dinucleotide-utilizing enzyme